LLKNVISLRVENLDKALRPDDILNQVIAHGLKTNLQQVENQCWAWVMAGFSPFHGDSVTRYSPVVTMTRPCRYIEFLTEFQVGTRPEVYLWS
jgi:hypothetical protein